MLDTINDILFWICLYALLRYAYILLFNKAIPNIRTAPAIRKKVIGLFQKEAKKKKDFTIFDLGCGNGHFTREIATAMPNAKVIGIEISKVAYWKCLFLKRLKGLKNLEYINADYFSADLKQANAVFTFGMGEVMEQVKEKLETDIAPKTLVISNKFPIRDKKWKPVDTIDIETLAPNQKTIHIYRR